MIVSQDGAALWVTKWLKKISLACTLRLFEAFLSVVWYMDSCFVLRWCLELLTSRRLWRAEAKMDGRGVVTNLRDKILSHIYLKKLLESYLLFDMLLLMTMDGVF